MVIVGDKNIKELKGTVMSSKNEKTISVKVESVKMHPLYKKRFKVYKKYYAHDEANQAKEGDTVVIRACRPLSRTKRRKLQENTRAHAPETCVVCAEMFEYAT